MYIYTCIGTNDQSRWQTKQKTTRDKHKQHQRKGSRITDKQQLHILMCKPMKCVIFLYMPIY